MSDKQTRTPAAARLRWVTTRELVQELAARTEEEDSSLGLNTAPFSYKDSFYYCARCLKDLGMEHLADE